MKEATKITKNTTKNTNTFFLRKSYFVAFVANPFVIFVVSFYGALPTTPTLAMGSPFEIDGTART
jgi:hypothetical protein